MKLFISWSGERSQTVAQALQSWLPLVLHYADPWLSDAHIGAGERWGQTVAKELEACNFGILCVTRENVSSPWVLFEAGSLAKSLEGSRVIPLLFDLEFSEIGGPLAQFQAKKADKEGISEVVQSLNKVAPQPIPEARANQLFEALWPQLEAQLAALPKHPANAKPIRPQPEVLEELVSGVRSLESRFKTLEEAVSQSDFGRPGRSRRLRRFHPMMMLEFSRRMGTPDDPVGLLIFASTFKDEFPWLYEVGVETYHAFRKGRQPEAKTALRRFRDVAEFTFRGPLAEEYGTSSKEFMMVFSEMEELLMRREERFLEEEARKVIPGPPSDRIKRE